MIESFRAVEAEAKANPTDAALAEKLKHARKDLSARLKSMPKIESDDDGKIRTALQEVQLAADGKHRKATTIENKADATPVTDVDALNEQAVEGADREQAEREKLLIAVRLAFSELGRAYDDAVTTAEQAVDNEEFTNRAKSIARKAFEDVAEAFQTQLSSDVDFDNYLEESERLMSEFIGENEELEVAKKVLGDAFDQLVQCKEEAEQAA